MICMLKAVAEWCCSVGFWTATQVYYQLSDSNINWQLGFLLHWSQTEAAH